jgi:hypothetical protein
MNINATFEGVDFWSRCVIRTEKGTKLVDIDCYEPEVIKADPNKGHWNTVIGDEEEPNSAIRSDIVIILAPPPEPNASA